VVVSSTYTIHTPCTVKDGSASILWLWVLVDDGSK
jgi:hypothetical protein